MNRKNIALFFLILFCLFLIYAWRSERTVWEDRPLSAADYGGLIALRDVLPPDQFKKEVLPFLKKASDGVVMTQRQLSELNTRLGDVSRQALAAAEKLRPQEELVRVWENTKQSASEMGATIGRSMGKAMDEVSRMVDEAVKPDAPAAPKGSTEPMPPTQI